MKTDRIDFISSYCDRWCERCTFTERCSAYACDVATAMCGGDLAAGIELAVGIPQPVSGNRKKTAGERFLEEFEPPSGDELAALVREEKERSARIEAIPISRLAWDYSLRSHAWLKENAPTLGGADPVVREALEIVQWDSTLVSAKLHRALDGRERSREDAWDDDPVQNDANGSAKLALILLERSAAAWQLIAGATGGTGAADLAAHAGRLCREVKAAFPSAMAFVRPGFDEPWR
jgi:hypothetical protein